jgi:hypothetical protein
VQQGDRQAPEGFYTVGRGQMNPRSLYHLAFNIGFPNAFDHANGHSGSALMVHGDCKSAGCYAMTDAYIEEIYVLAREAFNAGQTRFHVQALPFRMTNENMQRHRDNRWYAFCVKLKEGYDAFEATGKPPVVKVCGRQYLVNVSFPGQAADPAPDAPCPLYAKVTPSGVDGVPPTLLASLNKGETPSQPATQQTQQPVVMAAASPKQTAPKPEAPHAIAAAMADMSASPVITRSATNQLASAQPSKAPARAATPKTPAGPVYAAASKAPVAAPAPALASAASSVQTVNYSLSSAAFAAPPSPAPAEAPKAVDPDSLQKPNRSGKGGKLSAAPLGDAQQ